MNKNLTETHQSPQMIHLPKEVLNTSTGQRYYSLLKYINNKRNRTFFPRCVAARQREISLIEKEFSHGK